MIPQKNNFVNVTLEFLNRISDRVRRVRENKIAVAIIRLSVAFASILYLTFSLYQNRGELSQIKLELSWLIPATTATLLAVLMGSLSWWLILRSLGQKVKLLDAVYIHLYANILKYLPGIGWQQGGKFILSRPYVERRRTIIWGMTVEYMLLFSGGIAFAIGSLPWAIPSIQIESIQVLFSKFEGLWLVFIACMLLIVLSYLPYLITRKTVYTHTKWISTFLVIVTILIGWFLLSLALNVIGQGLSGANDVTYAHYAFTAPVAFLLGLAVVFVPGGLGVRESAMAYILQWVISPGLAVLIALFARACIAIAELMAFVFIALIHKVNLKSHGAEGKSD